MFPLTIRRVGSSLNFSIPRVSMQGEEPWPYQSDECPIPGKACGEVTTELSRYRSNTALNATNRCCRIGCARTADITKGERLWRWKKRSNPAKEKRRQGDKRMAKIA